MYCHKLYRFKVYRFKLLQLESIIQQTSQAVNIFFARFYNQSFALALQPVLLLVLKAWFFNQSFIFNHFMVFYAFYVAASSYILLPSCVHKALTI